MSPSPVQPVYYSISSNNRRTYHRRHNSIWSTHKIQKKKKQGERMKMILNHKWFRKRLLSIQSEYIYIENQARPGLACKWFFLLPFNVNISELISLDIVYQVVINDPYDFNWNDGNICLLYRFRYRYHFKWKKNQEK